MVIKLTKLTFKGNEVLFTKNVTDFLEETNKLPNTFEMTLVGPSVRLSLHLTRAKPNSKSFIATGIIEWTEHDSI